ncbi:MAG: OFA family MFS transporter [Eubacteriales bacterium]|nr:OFA family MFS transporter [Eubacteriales bacterium]
MNATKNRGLIVLFAGLGVNLMLGTLYAWGVISKALITQYGWTATQTQLPYMTACAVFAFSMMPGGKLQDRLGPRPIIMASAVLAGIGFIFAGYFLTLLSLTIGFGIIFGMAMGSGYAAPTPAAIKWFHPSKRGIVSGVVVSGFGLAPVYVAPLTTYLLENFGISITFYTLGIGFFIGIMLLAQLIKNPPAGYCAPVPANYVSKDVPGKKPVAAKEYHWREMIKTKQFFMLWTMLCFGTFAGLLVIGQLSNIGLEQAGIQAAFTLTIIYAIFNALGRISWGVIMDKIGGKRSLLFMFMIQVVFFAAKPLFTTPLTLMISIAAIGFTFGGMLTVFPAMTGNYYGMKNFGMNYGMVITAWGIGGVLGPLLGGIVRDVTGVYTYSYMASAVISFMGAMISLRISAPDEKHEAHPADIGQGYISEAQDEACYISNNE